MQAIEVRPVRREEWEAWLVLRQRLWPDHDPEDLDREQARILADPLRNTVLVATLPNGRLIGFLEASLREWAEGCRTEPVGYIEGWFVEDEYRRSGVGRRLVAAAEDWARSKGCTEMGSDAEDGNEVSRKAHGALGYAEVARLICFAKSLTSTTDDANRAPATSARR